MKFFKDPLLKPFRGRVWALCCITVLSALLQITATLWMRDVVDAALLASGQLTVAGSLLVANMAAIVALYGLGSWLSGSTMDRSVASLRRRLLAAAACREDHTVRIRHSGTLLSRGMEDVRTLCDGFVHALPSLTGQVTRLVGSFGAILVLYPSIAVYVALAAVAIVSGAALLRPVLKRHHARVRKADEQVLCAMQEDLRQLELIKSIGAEQQTLERFDGKLDTSLRAKARRRLLSVGTNTLISGATNLSTAFLLLWGVGRVADGAMSYGALTAMLQLLSLLRSPVLSISGLWTRLTAVEVAAERLQDLLDAPQPTEQPAAVRGAQALVFQNVTFTYPGDEEPVLRDFSAEYPLDKWLCLSGVSGLGKSTVFKLILGLYQPQQGSVSLRTAQGSVPCGPATRHLFAYVPQDYALFSGTIEENLLLAAPDSTAQQRERALHLACADFVFALTDGMQTQLRENNDGLSKGQLQRIAVARAILMDRPVLLMDECTSALDGETERAMLENLYSLNKKAILVTHRPEALEGLDNVCREELEAV